jgi:hypothetical protein
MDSVAQDAGAVPPTMPATLTPLSSTWRWFEPRASQLAAVAGWLIAVLLALVLLRLNQQWRTSFRNREWLLVPSAEGQSYLWGLQQLIQAFARTRDTLEHSQSTVVDAVAAGAHTTDTTRREFTVLREELERRTEELEAARAGVDLWHRRAVLRAIARASEMIRDDRALNRDAQSTLDGLAVELEECLDQNRVTLRYPTVGAPLASDSTVDLTTVIREPTTDDSLRGTIASVDRPAYVAERADGKIDVLLPARVRIFV